MERGRRRRRRRRRRRGRNGDGKGARQCAQLLTSAARTMIMITAYRLNNRLTAADGLMTIFKNPMFFICFQIPSCSQKGVATMYPDALDPIEQRHGMGDDGGCVVEALKWKQRKGRGPFGVRRESRRRLSSDDLSLDSRVSKLSKFKGSKHKAWARGW